MYVKRFVSRAFLVPIFFAPFEKVWRERGGSKGALMWVGLEKNVYATGQSISKSACQLG